MSGPRTRARVPWWCGAFVIVASAAAGCADAEAPTAATTSTVAPTAVATVVPEGFADTRVVIRRADGTICELCTYLAHVPVDRKRGLMGVTDLAGRDGMIFVYDEPGTLSFWMKDTVMSLSAAWFAADGAFISAFDMAPCPAGTDRCRTYWPGDPALHVLEVPQGDLVRLGIGPGSTLIEFDGPCAPAG